MSSTYTCEISFVAHSPNTRKGYIIPSLKSGPLLSLGQLCDDGCIILLNKLTIKIYKKNAIIIQRECDLLRERGL